MTKHAAIFARSFEPVRVSERKKHKFFNLLRFGYLQGWIIPISGHIIVAESTPQYFRDRLSRFQALFQAERQPPLPLP
jgi:hypothetical protein